ncbi:uncharacterized protein LOC116349812, partial [Contarinia nasturtii]|uniref:uncharacterized protein LOC116349812 n=1 Tax=Contarinia nasturtii TaxID=265458 RepID=UPI0012D43F51
MIDVNKIAVPRWLGISPKKSIEIHGFSDASNSAYGMTFYARVESGFAIECNLITSKTRVAPLKGMTIPRMELCEALMMAQMCQQICSVHDVSMNKLTLWTDSSIVIHWLSKCPSGLKAFVGNRVAEAQECTKGAQWKHVRTNDNPADLASRGLFASGLVGNSLWFHGPHWLSKPHSDWPVSSFTVDQRVKEATVAESRAIQACAIIRVETVPRIEVTVNDVTSELLLDRCSSMMRLVCVTARVLAFIRMIKTKEKVCSTFIAHADYLEAQAIWIKYHQQKYFAGDIELLKNGKSLSRDSIIVKMSPFVDGDGLLRVGGRIKRSMMSFDTKHPIILHHDYRFSHLLVVEAHRRTLHGGTQLCIQYIRQRFWMIGVRKAVKKVSLKCMPCFRQRKEVADQLMGDLPSVRVISDHPFESVGVDYCGPVMIKERSGRCKKLYKAYIAVFVCMKTKAVHLDLVTDLTTDAFMACLTRLVSLRGSVREIFSDNATTFHGAANEQKEIFMHWKGLSLSESLQLLQVKWTFITPLSPSQGGLWERN